MEKKRKCYHLVVTILVNISRRLLTSPHERTQNLLVDLGVSSEERVLSGNVCVNGLLSSSPHTWRRSSAEGRMPQLLTRHLATKSWKTGDQAWVSCSLGGSFWGMWYSADMVFISNSGGLFSASSIHVMPNDQMSA